MFAELTSTKTLFLFFLAVFTMPLGSAQASGSETQSTKKSAKELRYKVRNAARKLALIDRRYNKAIYTHDRKKLFNHVKSLEQTNQKEAYRQRKIWSLFPRYAAEYKDEGIFLKLLKTPLPTRAPFRDDQRNALFKVFKFDPYFFLRSGKKAFTKKKRNCLLLAFYREDQSDAVRTVLKRSKNKPNRAFLKQALLRTRGKGNIPIQESRCYK